MDNKSKWSFHRSRNSLPDPPVSKNVAEQVVVVTGEYTQILPAIALAAVPAVRISRI